MKRRDFIFCALLSAVGCKTLNSGTNVEIHAEQTLSIALSSLDSFLLFEYKRRGDLPKEVQDIAARLRRYVPQALVTANNLRLSYKNNRSAEKAVSVTSALAMVDSFVGEIRVWIPKSVSGRVGTGNIDKLIQESAGVNSTSVGSWVVLVPIFVDLAREVYKVVKETKASLNQTQEWSDMEDTAFSVRLQTLLVSDHWKP